MMSLRVLPSPMNKLLRFFSCAIPEHSLTLRRITARWSTILGLLTFQRDTGRHKRMNQSNIEINLMNWRQIDKMIISASFAVLSSKPETTIYVYHWGLLVSLLRKSHNIRLIPLPRNFSVEPLISYFQCTTSALLYWSWNLKNTSFDIFTLVF